GEYPRDNSEILRDATIFRCVEKAPGCSSAWSERLTGGQEVSRVQIPAPRPTMRFPELRRRQREELLHQFEQLLAIVLQLRLQSVMIDDADRRLDPLRPAFAAHVRRDTSADRARERRVRELILRPAAAR